MMYLVTSVIDGDTFIVSPSWQTNGKTGDRVRIANFHAPELTATGGSTAKQTLERLIGNKQVVLSVQAVDVYGRLVAEVRLNEVDITQHLLQQDRGGLTR